MSLPKMPSSYTKREAWNCSEISAMYFERRLEAKSPIDLARFSQSVQSASTMLFLTNLHKTCTQDPDVKLGNQEPRIEGVWHIKCLHELLHVYSLAAMCFQDVPTCL